MKDDNKIIVYKIVSEILWAVYAFIFVIQLVSWELQINIEWQEVVGWSILQLGCFFVVYIKCCKYFISNFCLLPVIVFLGYLVFAAIITKKILLFKVIRLLGLLVYIVAFIIVFKKTSKCEYY